MVFLVWINVLYLHRYIENMFLTICADLQPLSLRILRAERHGTELALGLNRLFDRRFVQKQFSTSLESDFVDEVWHLRKP